MDGGFERTEPAPAPANSGDKCRCRSRWTKNLLHTQRSFPGCAESCDTCRGELNASLAEAFVLVKKPSWMLQTTGRCAPSLQPGRMTKPHATYSTGALPLAAPVQCRKCCGPAAPVPGRASPTFRCGSVELQMLRGSHRVCREVWFLFCFLLLPHTAAAPLQRLQTRMHTHSHTSLTSFWWSKRTVIGV